MLQKPVPRSIYSGWAGKMGKLEEAFDSITDEQLDQMIGRARQKIHEREAIEREKLSDTIKAALKAKKDKEPQ